MKLARLATRLQSSMIALVLMSVSSTSVLAQVNHSHTPQPQPNLEQASKAGALLKIVRESTERFKDVSVAESEGYALQFGCVSGPDQGAMGLHYVNSELVNKGVIERVDKGVYLMRKGTKLAKAA